MFPFDEVIMQKVIEKQDSDKKDIESCNKWKKKAHKM